MKLSEIRAEVIDLIQVLTKMPDYSQSDVDALINRGYYDFVKKSGINISKVAEFTLTAGKQWYNTTDVPALKGLFNINAVQYIPAGATDNGYWLKPLDLAMVPRYAVQGVPEYYILRRQKSAVTGNFELGFYPVPNDAGKIIIDGTQRLQDTLALDDDAPDEIDEEYHEALVYYAAWRMFLRYSHRNQEFMVKAREMERLYREFIERAQFDYTFNAEDFPTIQFDD